VGSRPELPIQGAPYARYIAIGGIAILLIVLTVVLISNPHVSSGLKPGTKAPPFAVPLATGDLSGKADIAVHANEGSRGKVAACEERQPGALNICQLYEDRPVVLALFVNLGSCPKVLPVLQAAAQRFPEVSFAAVATGGQHAEIRHLVRHERLSIPVGFDEEGQLVGLYNVLSCPQLSFIYPGGVMQSVMTQTPSSSALDARVAKLLAASRARGWSAP
jgi:hypothetical protein